MTVQRGVPEASVHVSGFRYHRAGGSTHVTSLRDLELIIEAASIMRERTIVDMRNAGFTWREIGECIGVSPEVARQRWHRSK